MKNRTLFSCIRFFCIFTVALLGVTFAASAQTVNENDFDTYDDFSNNNAAKNSEPQYDTSGGPVQFYFKYQKDSRYRILSTVNEDVFVNTQLDHHSTIVNRISVAVTGTDNNGGATHEASFMTTEDATGSKNGAHFSWGEEYKSIFSRDAQGVYTISDEFFMPVVRDVPVFPKKAVVPGEQWTADGHEAHDLRRGFGIQTPYKVPFTATYTYLGTVKKTNANKTTDSNVRQLDSADGVLHVFNVKYTLYYESPAPQSQASSYSDWPAMTMGYSNQTIYWDADKGAIDHYGELVRIIIETAYGTIYEFRGDAHAEVTEFIQTNTNETVASVQKEVDKLGLNNVSVSKGEKGLTISVEDIKFKADSAELLDSEKEKLKQIATILKSYPENDILVSGHTALAGTASVRQQLSEERAQAVADYLVELGVKDRYHIFTQGFGATKPVADNSTEAGKAKNRRVEITIMDK